MKENEITEEVKKIRVTDFPVHPLILNRWSPRSMTGEHINDRDFFTMLDAAKWAPSSYNNQPWRFIYAKKDTEEFNKFLSFMIEFNQNWASKAAFLIVIISKNTFDKNQKPSITHSFDTGAAWENMALQGISMGYVVHGMQGFDYEKVKKELKIPDDYTVEAMAAIGVRGSIDLLSDDLKEREKPSLRKNFSELVMVGKFK
jgi:nitroreductase